MNFIIAIDPGSDKCGYAVIQPDGSIGEKGIVYLSELYRTIKRLCTPTPADLIILGNGTASKVIFDLIRDMDINLEVRFSDEKNTTFEARQRYFKDHPPTGIWRLIPQSLQTPPVLIDDYAAIIIGERYLKNLLE